MMDDLLNRAPCGFLAFSDDGLIATVNDTMRDLLGYGPGTLVGERFESLLPIASRIFFQTHFFPLIRLHGKAEEIFFFVLTKDRAEVPVLVNAVRREHEGTLLNHCVFVPVHQRRRYEAEILQAKRAAEEALRSNEELARTKEDLERHVQALDREISRLAQRNRELSRLGRVLSHDLREPVRKIVIFADLLMHEERDALTPAGVAALEKITGASRRMDTLIQTLQHYLSLGETEALTHVSLDEVVRTAAGEAIAATGVEDARIERRPLPAVQGYERQLVMLFYHLIENAIKFRRKSVPPEVRIDGCIVQHNSFRAIKGKYRYIDFARIEVVDNGIGFDNKYSGYVFDLMKKTDQETEGLGFGLPLVEKIVNNHFGSISVHSEPGVGTRFTILLPISQ